MFSRRIFLSFILALIAANPTFAQEPYGSTADLKLAESMRLLIGPSS